MNIFPILTIQQPRKYKEEWQEQDAINPNHFTLVQFNTHESTINQARWLSSINHKADKIRNAIAEVIEEGKVKTYDMMKIRGGADVFEKGACTTQEITDAVISKL